MPPKNKGQGGKNRRRGKKLNGEEEKRELVTKEEGQQYAMVLRMLGNGRLEAQCMDGKKRLCKIRGTMRKKIWINATDIILIGLREFEDKKADVLQKYSDEEARALVKAGEIPDPSKITSEETVVEEEDDGAFEFDEI